MTTLVLLSMFLSGTSLPVGSISNTKVQATQPPTIAVQKPSLGFLLGKLPKEVGSNIFADTASSGAKIDVTGIDLVTTSAEDLLDALLKKLPKATVWVKVYLPKTDAKRINGDSLAAYVFAQSNLVGKVGEIKKGFTEILGQQIPDEQATKIVNTLSLSPFYVIFRPGYVDRTEELSGAEREALIERLMSRPDLRGKYAAEHGKIMGEVIKRLVKDKVPAAP